MNTIEEKIVASLSQAFPDYFTECKPVIDEPGCIQVRVFGVADADIRPVKKQIFKIAQALDLSLIPYVCDLEDTTEFYPEYLPASSSWDDDVANGILVVTSEEPKSDIVENQDAYIQKAYTLLADAEEEQVLAMDLDFSLAA